MYDASCMMHLFPFFYFLSLYLKWVSFRGHIARFCFFIQSESLCFLIGMFRQFKVNVIIYKIFHYIYHITICFLFDTCVLDFFPFSFLAFLWIYWVLKKCFLFTLLLAYQPCIFSSYRYRIYSVTYQHLLSNDIISFHVLCKKHKTVHFRFIPPVLFAVVVLCFT